MQIEIDRDEAETMLKALECWEKDAGTSVMIGSLLSAVFCPENKLQEQEELQSKKMDKANEESRIRKIASIQLQAKLLRALTPTPEFAARSKEHQA